MSFRLARGTFFRTVNPSYFRVRPLVTRQLSTTSRTAKKVVSATLLIAGTTLFLVYYFDSRSAIHRYAFAPILRHTLDAETSHKAAVKVLRSGLAPKDIGIDDERLAIELWGSHLSNPIGLAAGFDKDGDAIAGLYDLGFGWVEVGSVTPKAQLGNPQPRVFRLLDDEAVINRYGFPSKGQTYMVSRILAWRRAYPESPHILSVNLGKNKSSSPDSISDFLAGIRMFAPLAPVLVINVSSPNTPGLRTLQGQGLLEELLAGAKKERDAIAEVTGKRAHLILKIAPDLTDEAVADMAEAVRHSHVDGVIVSNTTISRPKGLISSEKSEAGGLSGQPMKPLSLHVVRKLRGLLPASIPIIGCGGISSGADALDYARAGASAVQVYTSFTYDGVGTARRIKDEVTEELRKTNTTWADVTKDSIQRLAWKGDQVGNASLPSSQTTISVEDDIRALIKEAEDINALLEAVAAEGNQASYDSMPTANTDILSAVPPPVVIS